MARDGFAEGLTRPDPLRLSGALHCATDLRFREITILANNRQVTIELLDAIQDAFNRHDVDGILSYFADDCEWVMARGPDPWEGKRLRGKAAIAEVLSARYAVIPDMRWVDMSHFISADGSKACSEWTVKGTPNDGDPIDWLGCDVWTFVNGLVTKKDTYWKTIG